MKVSPVGVELIHANGHDEVRDFANSVNIIIIKKIYVPSTCYSGETPYVSVIGYHN